MQCPHCLQHFHENWDYLALGRDGYQTWGVGHTVCPACHQIVITVGNLLHAVGRDGESTIRPNPPTFKFVHPKAISRSPIPPEVTSEFATDYSEACLVLPDSEKASAALSRRCLQHLLREKAGIKPGNLANEIQQVLDSKQLPSHLADDLDAIRNIGNFATHPQSTNTGEIVEVEPHEAEWLLNLVEQLFDFYLVQPARAKARRDALNAKLQGIGKPPMKTS